MVSKSVGQVAESAVVVSESAVLVSESGMVSDSAVLVIEDFPPTLTHRGLREFRRCRV